MKLNQIKEDLLPDSLREIVDLIGLGATMKLVEQYGGIRVKIPESCRRNSELTKCVGIEASRKLTDVYGGDRLELPLMLKALLTIRDLEINQRLDAGESMSKLARQYHMTRRNILYIRSRHHDEPVNEQNRSLSLFG